ncbi:MAG: hypothetical protein ABJK11_11140 [Balneola sp.]
MDNNLKYLIENAFSFLERSIERFNEDPKFSVVHFSTAVELFLKARLMHEHWSIIVSGTPNLEKFLEGDFKSIPFSNLVKTINNVTNSIVQSEAENAFEKVAKHRNKIVHFYHNEQKDDSEVFKKAIAKEQSLSWFYLRRLLQDDWSEIFNAYDSRIKEINNMMKGHSSYLRTVYSQIKDDISQEITDGAIYTICPNCNFQSCKLEEGQNQVGFFSCKVCLFKNHFIELKCPECDKEDWYSSLSAPPNCECGVQIPLEDIDDQINSNPVVTADDLIDHIDISCIHCNGHETVVRCEDYFVCTNCLEVEAEISVCEYCSGAQNGEHDMSLSYLNGCEFCDGKSHKF